MAKKILEDETPVAPDQEVEPITEPETVEPDSLEEFMNQTAHDYAEIVVNSPAKALRKLTSLRAARRRRIQKLDIQIQIMKGLIAEAINGGD